MPILRGVVGCFLPSLPQIPVRTAPKMTAMVPTVMMVASMEVATCRRTGRPGAAGGLRAAPSARPPRGGRVECGLAGTVMRFLPPLAALSPEETLFDGDEQADPHPRGPTPPLSS